MEERELRREAVRRRLGGESPGDIARALGRTTRWVRKWVARAETEDSEDWAAGRSRTPHHSPRRTPEHIRTAVVEARKRLRANPRSQFGATAIAWELRRLGVEPLPEAWTINRILAGEGLTEPRRRTPRYQAKGVPYAWGLPAGPGEGHQSDLLGPRHLDGGVQFSVLNTIDLGTHRVMVLVWNGCALGESGSTEARSPSWREVTNPPDSRFAPFASAWTGAEVLSWGGLVLDPDRPRTTPGPPDSGTPEDPNPTTLRDGLAYDPAEDAWTRVPRAPVPPLQDTVGVWTGEELLIWGDHRERDRPTRTIESVGAAYSPQRDEWRHLPAAPEGPSYREALWTGDRLVLMGDAPEFSGRAAAAAYDPDTDAWSRLPDSPGGKFDWPRPVWTGDELLVLSDGGKLAAYSPETDSWNLRLD